MDRGGHRRYPSGRETLRVPHRSVLSLAVAIKYWPAVVAGLYLLYVLAAGDWAQVTPAIAALLTALGVNHAAVKAIDTAEAAHDVASFGPAPRGKGFRPQLFEIE
jgi:hypothetical protein